jgi:hypothetical protein
VAISAAIPVSRTSPRSMSNTRSEVSGSRLPVGSSASRSRGALASARQNATRCCSPARQLGRAMRRPIRQPDPIEKHRRPLRRDTLRHAMGQLRQDHVLQRLNSGNRWWNW